MEICASYSRSKLNSSPSLVLVEGLSFVRICTIPRLLEIQLCIGKYRLICSSSNTNSGLVACTARGDSTLIPTRVCNQRVVEIVASHPGKNRTSFRHLGDMRVANGFRGVMNRIFFLRFHTLSFFFFFFQVRSLMVVSEIFITFSWSNFPRFVRQGFMVHADVCVHFFFSCSKRAMFHAQNFVLFPLFHAPLPPPLPTPCPAFILPTLP